MRLTNHALVIDTGKTVRGNWIGTFSNLCSECLRYVDGSTTRPCTCPACNTLMNP